MHLRQLAPWVVYGTLGANNGLLPVGCAPENTSKQTPIVAASGIRNGPLTFWAGERGEIWRGRYPEMQRRLGVTPTTKPMPSHTPLIYCVVKGVPRKNFSLSDFYSVKIGHLMGFFWRGLLACSGKGRTENPLITIYFFFFPFFLRKASRRPSFSLLPPPDRKFLDSDRVLNNFYCLSLSCCGIWFGATDPPFESSSRKVQ